VMVVEVKACTDSVTSDPPSCPRPGVNVLSAKSFSIDAAKALDIHA
jgi:hypothetical protein